MDRLRKRSEFLAVAKGRRVNRPAFTLQVLARPGAAAAADSAQIPEASATDAPGGWRVGLTMTRQLGGAVVRNRVRRRLREALRAASAGRFTTKHDSAGLAPAGPGADIVVVGRTAALTTPFADLVAELAAGLAQARAIVAGAARGTRPQTRSRKSGAEPARGEDGHG